MKLITNLSAAQLRNAADIKERIDALQNQLSQLLGAPAQAVVAESSAPPGKRQLSAAALAKMRAGAKARWAKIKAAKMAVAKPASKPQGKISAAGLASIRAAQKARWAKVKSAAAPGQPVQEPKRKFSAQAIANIRAGVAKRMAARKSAKPATRSGLQHHISAAAKARLSALAKARWAKVKKAGKSRL